MSKSREEIVKKIHEKYPETRELKPTEEARLQWAALARDMDTILAEDYERYPTIPESDFINYLLPKLKTLSPETDLSIWKEMAGSYDRPIRVMGLGGEELFVVPPIYGSIKTHTATNGMDSISQHVESMRAHLDNIPVYGEQLLRRKILPKIKPVPISKEYVETWHMIAKRYGLAVKEEAVRDVTASKAAIFDDEEEL